MKPPDFVIYLDAQHRDYLEVIDKFGKIKYVLNLVETLNSKKLQQNSVDQFQDVGNYMKDLIFCFSKTLDYIDNLRPKNNLEDKLSAKLKEERIYLNNFRNIITRYEKEILYFDTYDELWTDDTLDKLMIIHIFITEVEWHISEISELKYKIIKIHSLRLDEL